MAATAVCFTGGKDSMLALHLVSGYQHHLIPSLPATPPVRLLVTFAPTSGSDFKAHPIPVIKALVAALGIPHVLCEVGPPSYLDSYRQQLRRLQSDHGITHLVTGDILDVAAGFMDRAVEGTGVQLVRPLWQCPRQSVLQALQDLQICSRISCVDVAKYQAGAVVQRVAAAAAGQQAGAVAAERSRLSVQDGSLQPASSHTHGFAAQQQLLGRELTGELVAGPLCAAEQLCGADLCGEHGEYHTLVFDAPMMSAPLRLVAAEHRVVHAGAYTHAYVVWEPITHDAVPA